MTRELKVGIFVGAAVLILAAFIFIVGDMTVLFKRSGFDVFARFDSAAGLDKRAAVKMAGVPVGYVKDIRLSRRQAEVELAIYRGKEIPRDSKATFATLGILGEKYVEILPGTSEENCRQGDSIPGIPGGGLDQIGPLLVSIGDQVKEAGGAIHDLLGTQTKTNLNQALENLASLSAELKDLVGSRQGLRETVRGAGRTFDGLDKTIDEIGSGARDSLKLLKDIAAENRESVKTDLVKVRELIEKIEESVKLLNSTLEKIRAGDGTLGKLIQDPGLYAKAEQTLDDVRRATSPLSSLRASLDFRADYYGHSELVRSEARFGLRLSPKLQVETGLVRNPWERRFTFSLLGGYGWEGIVARAGFIESELGFGLDYRPGAGRWSIGFEGFDFNRGGSPHLRVFSRFSLLKSMYVIGGLDDFSLSAKREFFFGLGVELR